MSHLSFCFCFVLLLFLLFHVAFNRVTRVSRYKKGGKYPKGIFPPTLPSFFQYNKFYFFNFLFDSWGFSFGEEKIDAGAFSDMFSGIEKIENFFPITSLLEDRERPFLLAAYQFCIER